MIAPARALAVGYALYFGAIGVFQPYWPVHLAALGVSAAGIGVLLAIHGGVRVVAPLGLAWLGDRVTDRRPLLRLLGFAGTCAVLGLARAEDFWSMAVALGLFSATFNAIMPIYDAHVLEQLGAGAHRYGRQRLWGSIGFVVTSAVAGALLGALGPPVVAPLLAVLVAATALALMRLPALPAAARSSRPAAGFLTAAMRPPVLVFLAVAFLQLASFGGYYGFYTLYLAAFGYAPATIGLYWAFGVVAEVAMFALGPTLLARYPLGRLLQVAIAGTVLRWALVAAFPASRPLMLGAQVLHLAGFGLFHSVTVLLGPRLLPPGSAARAQGLVSSLGWGAGGIAGSLLAGALWARAGPRSVFAASTLLALAALVLTVVGMDAGGSTPNLRSTARGWRK